MVLTRAEPSVLRAGTMAALAALAFAIGTEREPPRLLASAVVVLLLVDPLLVRSVGFWLSVGATAGVTVIGPPLRRRLSGLGPLATPLAMTAAAQLGVLVPSVLVFGQITVIGIVANLVAVPVAGLVMLYGLPASLVAGAVPALRGVLMLPVGRGDALGRHRRRRGRSHRTAPAVERRRLDRRPGGVRRCAFGTTAARIAPQEGDNDEP